MDKEVSNLPVTLQIMFKAASYSFETEGHKFINHLPVIESIEFNLKTMRFGYVFPVKNLLFLFRGPLVFRDLLFKKKQKQNLFSIVSEQNFFVDNFLIVGN